MADTRTTSTLDIKVNGRALAGLEKTLRKVFNRRTPREFNTAIGEVNRSIEKNIRHTEDLARALVKVETGSKAYKRLRQELAEANKAGAELHRTMRNLDREAARAAGRRRDSLGQFVGGPAGSRIQGTAGGGGGGGFRSSGQIPMPSVGAFSAALMAVPVAGGLAAGSMMASAQTYQSRLRYEQARMGAAPFLMDPHRAAHYRPEFETVAPKGGAQQRMAIEKGTGILRPVGTSGLTQNELAAAFYSREAADGRDPTRFGIAGTGVGAATMANLRMRGMRATGAEGLVTGRLEQQMLQQQRLLAEAMRPSLAEALDPESADARAAIAHREKVLKAADPFVRLGYERNRESLETGAAKKVRKPAFSDRAFREAGQAMGFAPAEALQMAGQMAQAAGTPVGAGEFRQSAALQRLFGIGVGESGGAMRGLRYAGQISGLGGGDMQGVANLVGSAMALGLEGSEISEYLRDQTGYMEQMAKQGIGVDIEQQRALEASISQSGIAAPWRAGDIGRQFMTGAARVGREGAGDAVSFRLMQAAGFQGGGLEEYFQTKLGMQSPALAKQFGMGSPTEMMSQFIESFRVEGVGAATQAGILQKAFGAVGTQIGPEEAMQFSRGLQQAAPGAFHIDTEAAERLVGALAPSVREEARIEGRRVDTGAQSAEMMQKLSNATINLAEIFNGTLGPTVTSLAGAIDQASGAITAAVQGLEIGMQP